MKLEYWCSTLKRYQIGAYLDNSMSSRKQQEHTPCISSEQIVERQAIERIT
jgi:hypothetical protein